MSVLRMIPTISTGGMRDYIVINPRLPEPTYGRFVPVINGMRGIAAKYMSVPQTVVSCKKMSGEGYPIRISCAHPLPEKGRIAIYGLIDPTNDEVFYVGQTVDFIKRIRCHCINRDMNSTRPLPSDARKLDIADAGLTPHAIVFFYADNKLDGDYLEHLAIKAFNDTTLNFKIWGETRGTKRRRLG